MSADVTLTEAERTQFCICTERGYVTVLPGDTHTFVCTQFAIGLSASLAAAEDRGKRRVRDAVEAVRAEAERLYRVYESGGDTVAAANAYHWAERSIRAALAAGDHAEGNDPPLVHFPDGQCNVRPDCTLGLHAWSMPCRLDRTKGQA